MRSSITSVICAGHSRDQVQMHRVFLAFELYHTLVLAGDSSYISLKVTFFSATNPTVTLYLLESSLAQFKKKISSVVCLPDCKMV